MIRHHSQLVFPTSACPPTSHLLGLLAYLNLIYRVSTTLCCLELRGRNLARVADATEPLGPAAKQLGPDTTGPPRIQQQQGPLEEQRSHGRISQRPPALAQLAAAAQHHKDRVSERAARRLAGPPCFVRDGKLNGAGRAAAARSLGSGSTYCQVIDSIYGALPSLIPASPTPECRCTGARAWAGRLTLRHLDMNAHAQLQAMYHYSESNSKRSRRCVRRSWSCPSRRSVLQLRRWCLTTCLSIPAVRVRPELPLTTEQSKTRRAQLI